jgi:uncharacterized lipoprotein YddW (UPF0748 family)
LSFRQNTSHCISSSYWKHKKDLIHYKVSTKWTYKSLGKKRTYMINTIQNIKIRSTSIFRNSGAQMNSNQLTPKLAEAGAAGAEAETPWPPAPSSPETPPQ